MGAKNRVIAGDYLGKIIGVSLGQLYIGISFSNNLFLNKDNIETYEVITDDQRKSAASGIARGAIGAALLGPVGLLAGLSAKNKGTYNVAIKFKDGKNSLVEIDDKVYKTLVKVMFQKKEPLTIVGGSFHKKTKGK